MAETGAGNGSAGNGSAETLVDYYSVPMFMMREYLVQLGGREVAPNVFAGEGWRAALSAAPWRHIGSLRVGGTRAGFSGAPEVLDAFFAELHKKTMRGGG